MPARLIIKRRFRDDLKAFFDYIKKDTPLNAEKFKDGIRIQLDRIKSHPMAYPKLDLEGLENNNGFYRFCHYMKSFKIIYSTDSETVTILGIVHDRQNSDSILTLSQEFS